jgi:hypothetical protein
VLGILVWCLAEFNLLWIGAVDAYVESWWLLQ